MFFKIVLIFVFSFPLSASEVDHFTNMYRPLEDSTLIINKMTNQLLKERLKKINKLNRGCKERSLYREIKKDLNIILKGSTFLEWIEETEEMQKQRLAVKDSIYRDWSLLDSPAILV